MNSRGRGARFRALLAALSGVVCLLAAAQPVGAQMPSFTEHRGAMLEGWTLERVDQQPNYVRLHFRQGERDAHMEINLRAQLNTGLGTERFSLQAAPEGFAPVALQEQVLVWLRTIESQPSSTSATGPPRVHVSRVVLLLQGILALAVMLLLVGIATHLRARTSSPRTASTWRPHILSVLVFTVSGALLRVAQGSRIPGFVGDDGAGHGFTDVGAALADRVSMLDPRGNGPTALYGLWFALWPRTEWALLTLQATLAVLTIPLVYLAALAWLRVQREATWATATYALYPSAAYFAMTEVRTVPGAFFLMLGLVVTGVGLERKRPLFLASGGLFAVFATSFHPVLVGAPLVLALFAVSRRDAWLFARSPRALLALGTVGAAWAILLRLVWLQLSLDAPSDTTGGGAAGLLGAAWRVVLPTFGLPRTPFNAFLNLQATPALLVLCWGLGVAGVRRPQRRRVLLTLALAALGMTVLGMAGGRYNLARLQYAAAPLHAMLAGVGCVALVEYLVGRLAKPRLRRAVPAVLALALGLSVAVSPGPLAGAFVHDGERQVTTRALPDLRGAEPCDVWVPPTSEGAYTAMPRYLTRGVLPHERWRSLDRVSDVPAAVGGSLARDGCAYYYRPSVCWTLHEGEAPSAEPSGLRPECAAVEAQLVLTPLHVESVVARSAGAARYRRPELEVGFFHVSTLASDTTAP